MWVVRLSEKQLEVLRAVIRSERHRGPALEGALEALDLARYDDLPEAQLPWIEVAHEAERQGVSEADVIWDMSGRLPEKACEPIDLTARLHEVLDDAELGQTGAVIAFGEPAARVAMAGRDQALGHRHGCGLSAKAAASQTHS